MQLWHKTQTADQPLLPCSREGQVWPRAGQDISWLGHRVDREGAAVSWIIWEGPAGECGHPVARQSCAGQAIGEASRREL